MHVPKVGLSAACAGEAAPHWEPVPQEQEVSGASATRDEPAVPDNLDIIRQYGGAG